MAGTRKREEATGKDSCTNDWINSAVTHRTLPEENCLHHHVPQSMSSLGQLHARLPELAALCHVKCISTERLRAGIPRPTMSGGSKFYISQCLCLCCLYPRLCLHTRSKLGSTDPMSFVAVGIVSKELDTRRLGNRVQP